MKPRYLHPFYWVTRFIQINRAIAAAIPPITQEDLESLRKFSEHPKQAGQQGGQIKQEQSRRDAERIDVQAKYVAIDTNSSYGRR
jgi:hypothetical protein